MSCFCFCFPFFFLIADNPVYDTSHMDEYDALYTKNDEYYTAEGNTDEGYLHVGADVDESVYDSDE